MLKLSGILVMALYFFNFVEDILGNEIHPERILSRKKRYVAFPEGSSLSASLCTTLGVIYNPLNQVDFSYAINWGISYDLPNETWAVQAANGFKGQPNDTKPVVQRRYRRDLYSKLELAIDSMGYNGRDCVLKALCESSKYFFKKTGNMIQELIKTIFSFPRRKIKPHEHSDIRHYDKAYRIGRETRSCASDYPDCHFSLIELALGKYSVPSKAVHRVING